jgi:hypothetical protein
MRRTKCGQKEEGIRKVAWATRSTQIAQEKELKRIRKSGWRTYFGRGIRQTVQGGTLARRRLADKCDERVARHFVVYRAGKE